MLGAVVLLVKKSCCWPSNFTIWTSASRQYPFSKTWYSSSMFGMTVVFYVALPSLIAMGSVGVDVNCNYEHLGCSMMKSTSSTVLIGAGATGKSPVSLAWRVPAANGLYTSGEATVS